MDEDSSMVPEHDHDQHDEAQSQRDSSGDVGGSMPAFSSPEPSQQEAVGGGEAQSAQVVVGPRCAPPYSVVDALMDKKEDGPGPRCGHTLTAVPAVGEEGTNGYIGPRLVLFGGATALEGNSGGTGTPTSAAPSAGIRTFLPSPFASLVSSFGCLLESLFIFLS